MLEIDFHQFDHNFCESTIYSSSQHPEYLNALSSLFITFIGLNAMRKPHLSIFLSIMYSCFAVNGVLSLLYHYYNSIGYGLLDRMSMVLLAWTTSYICFNTVKKLKRFNLSYCSNSTVHLCIVAYYSFLLTVAGLHKEILFNTLFGVFLGSISVYVYVVRHVDRRIISIGWKGIRYIILSAVFWITTEGLCPHLSFIKYLFGHVWWHVFISYGGYLVSIVPHYISLMDTCPDKRYLDLKYDGFGLPYLDYVDISHIV